jgi:hypothetical protein
MIKAERFYLLELKKQVKKLLRNKLKEVALSILQKDGLEEL